MRHKNVAVYYLVVLFCYMIVRSMCSQLGLKSLYGITRQILVPL